MANIFEDICEFRIFWMLLEYYIGRQGFYKFHKITFVCYHQELACTPNDPPRRVDINEMSLIRFYNKHAGIIDKTV